jgi:hypothetical protein
MSRADNPIGPVEAGRAGPPAALRDYEIMLYGVHVPRAEEISGHRSPVCAMLDCRFAAGG